MKLLLHYDDKQSQYIYDKITLVFLFYDKTIFTKGNKENVCRMLRNKKLKIIRGSDLSHTGVFLCTSPGIALKHSVGYYFVLAE